MSRPTLTLCRICAGADPDLPGQVSHALARAGIKARVQETDCMSGCTRPQTLAVRQSGKTAYLFGEVTAADLDSLCTFLRLYSGSPDGNLEDARPLGPLRFKAIARIPAELGDQE